MTAEERREQSQGVATVTQCFPGRADPKTVVREQQRLAALLGRNLVILRADADVHDRFTSITFAVVREPLG